MITLPDDDDTSSMYLAALEILGENCLKRYEVSNFAKVVSAQSSHNMSYWDGTQYLGIGPGAHSRFFPLDSSMRESRVQCFDPKLWQEMVTRDGHGTQARKQQSQIEILSELLVTSMRTTTGVQQKRQNITNFVNCTFFILKLIFNNFAVLWVIYIFLGGIYSSPITP